MGGGVQQVSGGGEAVPRELWDTSLVSASAALGLAGQRARGQAPGQEGLPVSLQFLEGSVRAPSLEFYLVILMQF